VTGIALDSDGRRLYASVPGKIEVLDGASGARIRGFALAGIEGLVGATEGR